VVPLQGRTGRVRGAQDSFGWQTKSPRRDRYPLWSAAKRNACIPVLFPNHFSQAWPAGSGNLWRRDLNQGCVSRRRPRRTARYLNFLSRNRSNEQIAPPVRQCVRKMFFCSDVAPFSGASGGADPRLQRVAIPCGKFRPANPITWDLNYFKYYFSTSSLGFLSVRSALGE